MANVLLEIGCGSLEDAIAAEAGGADRVELCSALFLGGLTPSLASVLRAKEKLRIPVMAMVRPRAAGFCYSATDMEVMLCDTDLFVEHGADGIVFGILKPDRAIDLERCRRIRERIGSCQAVFHRAFDVVPDPMRALDELIDLGCTRVLTSGQRNTALEGSALIRKLVEHARGRVEILPGAGIRTHNVRELIAQTGCTQVHTTAFRQLDDPSTVASRIQYGSTLNPSESAYHQTDSSEVRRLGQALDAI
jgi:copper homeostasis protein